MPPRPLLRTPKFSIVRHLAAGIAVLGLGVAVPAEAADPTGAPGTTGGLTITSPGQGLPSEYEPQAPTVEAAERMRLLEQQIERMAADGRQQQEVVQRLRERLAVAESASWWVPLLGIGLGAMALIAGWQGLRLRQVTEARRRERQDARMLRLIDARDDPPPAPAAAAAASPTPPPQRRPEASAPASTSATAVPDPTEIARGAAAQRAVSVEEMLDLEQQADFFMVLGQEEEAIDLLMGHIRASGGASPMPYLKLLEIYHRRGDEENYERTRTRFNLRFNATAPAFADDLDAGRDLEQYPALMQRIEQAWPNSLTAMAELDALLFRRDDAEPFDLPAYRELMLLSAVAHDLRDAHGQSLAAIDLLLPLEEGPSNNSTSVRRALASRLADTQSLPHELMSHLLVQRDREPSTLDLDLSDFTPAPREFTRPAAFTDVELRNDSRQSDMGAFDTLEPPPPGRSRQ